jgi:hypothetical protein
MDASELKTELLKKIRSLSADKIQRIYGKIINDLNGTDDTEEWESLNESEKEAILDGIHQLDHGNRVEHHKVLNEARKKYAGNKSGRLE